MKKQAKPETKTVRVEIFIRERGQRPSRYRSAMVDYSDEDARYVEPHYDPATVKNVPMDLDVEEVRIHLQSMIDRGKGYSVPIDWPLLARDLEGAGVRFAAGGR